MRYGHRQTAALIAIGVALSGCGETKPSNFYLLSSLPQTAESHRTDAAGVIGVGPIDLPKYLDRTHIVTFTGANQVSLAEYDRWAEPLPDNFRRVLVENLSVLLPDWRVESLPFISGIRGEVHRRLAIEVTRFHTAPDGKVELRANWHVLGGDGRRRLLSGATSVSEARASDSYNATVAAMSRAVATMSREIAGAMERLPRTS
jgi:uncharacterized lipoprotein YmbA